MDVLKFNLKGIIYKTKDKKYEKMVGKHLKIYISSEIMIHYILLSTWYDGWFCGWSKI